MDGPIEEHAPLRDIVSEWIDEQGDAPDDFADAVIDAWRTEAQADDVVIPLAPRSRFRHVVAMVAGLAAAAAVIVLMLRPSGGMEPVDAVASTDATEDPSPQLEALRSELGSVLAARCAPCHRGDSDEAKPMALDVFDASAERWWTSVSTRQLGALQQRLTDEPTATEPERALVSEYVVAELAHRG